MDAAAAIDELKGLSTQIEVIMVAGRDGAVTAATVDDSVFVVLDGDRMAVATTGADPTVGLVFYDLKTLLRQLAPAEPGGEPAAPAEEPASAEEAGGDA